MTFLLKMREWYLEFLFPLLFILFLIPIKSYSKDLFTSLFNVADEFASEGTNSITNLSELFDDDSLSELFSGYTPMSGVNAVVDLRGVKAVLRYQENSNTLEFRIPGTDIDVSFTGTDRDDAQEKFEDWLKGKGDADDEEESSGALSELLQLFIQRSPVDPVAGNPNSLQSRMIKADFDVGISEPYLNLGKHKSNRDSVFNIAAYIGSFSGGPYDGQIFDLDLTYRAKMLDNTPLYLILDIPITLTLTEGSWSVFSSASLGLNWRPTDWWSITGSGRFGAAGSLDVGALGALYDFALTNYFFFDMLGYDLGFGVLGAYSKSIDDIEVAGYNFNYDLESFVLKMGADYRNKINFNFFNLPSALRIYLYETIFLGDDLYLEHYIETGIELLSKRLNYSKEIYHMMTIGVEFVTGLDNDYDSINLKISYRY